MAWWINGPVIIISAQNTVITAIKASELGAYDYLPKPFDLKKLLSKVNKALSNQGSNNNIIQQDGAVDQELPLIGSSPLMQDVYRFLARVLHTDLSTIITGESGTGKDLLAHTMHDLGSRAPMDFVRINISSSNIDKIEGTLIGGKEDLNISPALKSSTIYFDENKLSFDTVNDKTILGTILITCILLSTFFLYPAFLNEIVNSLFVN